MNEEKRESGWLLTSVTGDIDTILDRINHSEIGNQKVLEKPYGAIWKWSTMEYLKYLKWKCLQWLARNCMNTKGHKDIDNQTATLRN